MANLNKVMLIGRLTRDPEIRTFANGGKVANIGFAVNNRKKNQQTGEWENDPVFLDVKAFNRETGRKLADLVEQYLHKGNQVYIEGHLTLEQWTSQDGQKQSKLKVILEDMQFLEPKADGAGGEGTARPARPVSAARKPTEPRPADNYGDSEPEPYEPPAPANSGGASDIPF